MKTNLAHPKFILFPAAFLPTHISTFAKCQRLTNAYFAKELISPLLSVFFRIFCDERKNHTATLSSYILSKFLKTKPYPYQWINIFQKHPFRTMSGSFH